MTRLAKEGDWPRAYNVRAAEEVKPGDVIVVDLGGGIPDGIFFGDVSAIGARVAGARRQRKIRRCMSASWLRKKLIASVTCIR